MTAGGGVSPALVKELIAARDERRLHRPPSEETRLSLAQACAVQDALREALVTRGERVAGWKSGYTTRAGQEAAGVSGPVSAFLLAGDTFPTGTELPAARFVKPAVEAEIAFVMRRELAGPGVTMPRALTAVEGAMPALELIDFRYSGKPHGTDVIADGVYANAVVLTGSLTSIVRVQPADTVRASFTRIGSVGVKLT